MGRHAPAAGRIARHPHSGPGPLRRNALSTALLLGLGMGGLDVLWAQTLSNAGHAGQGGQPSSQHIEVAQSAIAAIADIAARAGQDAGVAQAAIAAISQIASGTQPRVALPGGSSTALSVAQSVQEEPVASQAAAAANDRPVFFVAQPVSPPVMQPAQPATPAPSLPPAQPSAPIRPAQTTELTLTGNGRRSGEADKAREKQRIKDKRIKDKALKDKALKDRQTKKQRIKDKQIKNDSLPVVTVMPKGGVRLVSETPLTQTPEALIATVPVVPVSTPTVMTMTAAQPDAAPAVASAVPAPVPATPAPDSAVRLVSETVLTATTPAPAQAGAAIPAPVASADVTAVPPVQTPAPKPAPKPAPSASGAYDFDASLLAFPVDLSLFADGNPVLPGMYRLDVYLNDTWAGKFDVRFANRAAHDRIAQPCFDAEFLQTLGFDPQHYTADAAPRLHAGQAICGPLAELVPGAQAKYDSGTQQLRLIAPQAVLVRTPRGYVDPKRWDAGITAATLAYSYNGYSSTQGDSQSGSSTQTSHYLGLRSGLNLGHWRVRLRGSVNRPAHGHITLQRDSLYVERGVPSLKSRLVVGESATSGHVFDSLSVLGAQLVSDARMRPDAQGAFVPIIRGIAQGNARVTVHQRGEQIFEMTVPPGPFVIDDLYPNGRGGDLLITVHEADGSTHSFTETYANLPEMLRPGTFHYSATVGRYRNRSLVEEEPVLGMLTASYGFNNTWTGYGGVMLAAGYHSASLGAGLNLPIGAVSVDGTWANTRAVAKTGGGYSAHGYAFRLGYTKLVPQLDTDVTLAMYRYATQGFYDPAQAFQLRDAWAAGKTTDPAAAFGADARRRNQLAVRMSHQLKGARWGAFSLGASVQDYWHHNGRDLQYHVGWGRNFGSASVGLTLSRSRHSGGTPSGDSRRWENQAMLTVSLPLGAGSRNPAYLNSSVTKHHEGVAAQASLSGTLGGTLEQRNPVGYSLFASGDRSTHQPLRSNGGASVRMTTPLNRLGASVSAGAGRTRQMSLSGSGAVVGFRGGLVLAPDLGETIGIVQAQNASGAVVQGSLSTVINARGHAVVPYLQPYRENDVRLNPKGLSADVELAATSQKIVPTEGAVALLNYTAHRGYAVLVSGQRTDGNPLPFAAGVLDANGRNVGYVAQGGRALIRANAPVGTLTVRWGAKADEQCHFGYNLQRDGQVVEPDSSGFRRVEVVCE